MALGDLKRYAFINAKLRSRIANMFDDKGVELLINSTSLEELFQHLIGSAYEPLIQLYDESGDIERLESWLFARSISLYKEVAALMEGSHSDVVVALNRKQEVENLKGVIRLWFSNKIKGQNIDYRFGYLYQKPIVSTIDWELIINAKTFKEIVDELGKSPYKEAFAELDIEKLSSDGLFFLETALDRIWIKLLRQSVAKMTKADRLLVEAVLDRDADLKNIINLVRFGYLYNLDVDNLKKLMLKGGKVTSTEEFEKYLATSKDKRSIESLVERHFPDLAKMVATGPKSSPEEQTLKVEHYLFKVRRNSYNKMLRGYPFSFGTILAYFFLEERQNNLIRTVINGINYQLNEKQIREAVL
jgi:V/A-type H+-transporting ATPase subunit C